MALSKAVKANRLFTQKASNAVGGDCDFSTTINSGSALQSNNHQWKLKEVVYQRDAGAAALTAPGLQVLLHDNVTGKEYVLKTVAVALGGLNARVVPNLTDGEYIIDSDCEIRIKTAGGGAGEPWSVRVTGVIA